MDGRDNFLGKARGSVTGKACGVLPLPSLHADVFEKMHGYNAMLEMGLMVAGG